MTRYAPWGGLAAAVLAACLTMSPAFADPSGFLGNWVNVPADNSGLFSSLVGSKPDASGIVRVVVTPAGISRVHIQILGQCPSGVCDWGTQIGRPHSADPNSAEVLSITADFTTGSAQKRVTLRPGPGGNLRFDVTTDFTDGSGNHDFEISGRLTAAPAAIPLANASTAVTVPLAVPVANPTVGTATSLSVVPAEDCVAINPADVYVAPSDRGWKLSDYNHTILNFGTNKLAALKAQTALDYYHIDEQCFVVRPHARMIYWRSSGQVPRTAMPNQDCIDIHPTAVHAAQSDGVWKVMDDKTTVLDYGEDQAGAQLAVSVISSYRLTRQCFIARPDATMSYWLSQ